MRHRMVEPGSELYEKLWSACLSEVEKITKASIEDRTNRGSGRSPAYLSLGSEGVMCTFMIYQEDGRGKFHVIEAKVDPWTKDININVTVEVYWTDHDRNQQVKLNMLKDEPDRVLIVNHKFYSIGDGRGPVKGFGGRKVRYQRIIESQEKVGGLDAPYLGEPEETNDLWSGGPIPPAWWDRLPDNAVFLDGFDGPTVMY